VETKEVELTGNCNCKLVFSEKINSLSSRGGAPTGVPLARGRERRTDKEDEEDKSARDG
jgi:hypothetical protein